MSFLFFVLLWPMFGLLVVAAEAMGIAWKTLASSDAVALSELPKMPLPPPLQGAEGNTY